MGNLGGVVLRQYPALANPFVVEREVDGGMLHRQRASAQPFGVARRKDSPDHENEDGGEVSRGDVGVKPTVGAAGRRKAQQLFQVLHAPPRIDLSAKCAAKRPESITRGTPPPGWVPPPV